MIDAMATISGPLTDGILIRPASLVSFDLAGAGYVEQEFLVSGTACGYDVHSELSADGLWDALPDVVSAPFTTRVLVRRPADRTGFSGVALVEWLNVSSGLESDADWTFLHEEIVRAGHAYIGVSAQSLGINGGRGRMNPGGPAVPGLRDESPARYGALVHPGDRYSFDIFRQIGEVALGMYGGNGGGVLGGLPVESVIAIGESQSAFYLTTYLNAVDPLWPVYDGFFVHSRGAGIGPLNGDPIDPERDTVGVRIRSDRSSPVLVLQTEGDLLPPLSYWRARQPDTDRIRVWEMAGTSHADAYLIGPAAPIMGCTWRINEGPQRYVLQAALRALVIWCADGTRPASAARIDLKSENPPVISRDEAGVAQGGVRTPVVDAPVVTLSGEGPKGEPLSWLVGSTAPLSAAYLRARYGDKAGYLRAFAESLDAALSGGFLLPSHREPLLHEAEAFDFPAA